MKRTKLRGFFVISDYTVLDNIIKNHEKYSTKATVCELKCEHCGKIFTRNLRHLLEVTYYKECSNCASNHIKEDKYGKSKMTENRSKLFAKCTT